MKTEREASAERWYLTNLLMAHKTNILGLRLRKKQKVVQKKQEVGALTKTPRVYWKARFLLVFSLHKHSIPRPPSYLRPKFVSVLLIQYHVVIRLVLPICTPLLLGERGTSLCQLVQDPRMFALFCFFLCAWRLLFCCCTLSVGRYVNSNRAAKIAVDCHSLNERHL